MSQKMVPFAETSTQIDDSQRVWFIDGDVQYLVMKTQKVVAIFFKKKFWNKNLLKSMFYTTRIEDSYTCLIHGHVW